MFKKFVFFCGVSCFYQKFFLILIAHLKYAAFSRIESSNKVNLYNNTEYFSSDYLQIIPLSWETSKQAYSICFWKASTYLSNNQFKLHLPEMREKNKLLKLISLCKWYIVFNKHVANLIEWLSVYVWVGGRCFQ